MPTLVIIGGGPAGLSAAIYAVRAGLDVHVLYKDDGALGKADRIENYFGFPDVIPGAELLARGQAQADRLGARLQRTEVTGIEYADRGYAVKTTGGARHADAALVLHRRQPRQRPARAAERGFAHPAPGGQLGDGSVGVFPKRCLNLGGVLRGGARLHG